MYALYVHICTFLNLDVPICEYNVFDTIIPEQCHLTLKADRVEVNLTKLRPQVHWTSLHNVQVCVCVFYACIYLYVKFTDIV